MSAEVADLTFSKKGLAPTWRLSSLTPGELSVVISHLSDRLKSSVEMVAESRIVQALDMLQGKQINEGDTVTVTMDVQFNWMEIIQIVGEYRRKYPQNEKHYKRDIQLGESFNG